MDCYKLKIKRSAEKELRKIHPQDIKRVVLSIQALAREPHPASAQPIKGSGQFLRIRVGDYRIVYEVDEKALEITVTRIAHRRDVYRGLGSI